MLHVTSVDGVEPINELVVVDAEFGAVALHFDQIETALNRRICDANETATQVPCAAPVRTEGGPPVADTFDDVNKAYEFSGDTYNFYFNRFGGDSLNNAGLTLNNTVDFCLSVAGRLPVRQRVLGRRRRWSTATATPRATTSSATSSPTA